VSVDPTTRAATTQEQLRARLGGFRPRVLLTLGSGLGALAEEVTDPVVVAFGGVGLPGPTVPGHAGRFVAGSLVGVPVLIQQGRVHLYEGVPVSDVTAAVRAAHAVGADTFVVTNAAGGLGEAMDPGDLMLIADQLNLTGVNPLIGLAQPLFLDMKDAYDPVLRAWAHDAAKAAGEPLGEGVYAGLVGPAYETPAEVRMLRLLGADAVGMSTVCEVVAARALGMRVLGVSLLTNVHRPGGTPTDHQEVLDAGRTGGPRMARLVRAVVAALGERGGSG
jgi:purine-nucleoside phosphorylase